MNKRSVFRYVGATLGFFLTGVAFAQIASQNVDQHFITNARAAGLADAIVSDATDVTGMYWNPSLLTFLREGSIVFNYSLEKIRGDGNIMNENLVVPLIGEKGWGLGIGATYSHVGRVHPGSPLSGYRYQQVGIDVGLARAISNSFSMGAATTARYGRAGSRALGAISSSVGICYFPSPEVSYGVSYQGIGDGIEYTVDPFLAQTNMARFKLSHSLQLGVTVRLKALEEKPVLSITVANQKIFGTKGVVYKGGVEVWPTSFLALRTGYWVGTETVSGRLGCGVRIDAWQIDYALSTTELEPQFHQLSLSYCFRSYSIHH